MQQALKVLHLSEKNQAHTGSVVQMLESAVGLAERGHQVVIASRPDGDLEQLCTGTAVAFAALQLRYPFDLSSALRLRRLLKEMDPQLIHVHKGRAHAVALIAAAGLGRRPRLVVNRGVSFPLDRLNRLKYRHPRVATVVCVAEAVREVVIRSGALSPDRVTTIHSATDLRRFDPDRTDRKRVRAELGLREADLLVGQVSVREWKGWRQLLAAAAALKASHPELRLVLVGCEPEDQQQLVLDAASALGVAEQLRTLPFRNDMPEVLDACDVVVDASFEGSGITGTIREAMAMGRAVVASDCAGNPELVQDGVNGLVFRAGDQRALAAALGRLLGDADLRARLGERGRRRVVEHFSLEKKLDRLEELYRRVVSMPRHQAP